VVFNITLIKVQITMKVIDEKVNNTR